MGFLKPLTLVGGPTRQGRTGVRTLTAPRATAQAADAAASGESSSMQCINATQDGTTVSHCFAKTEGLPVITPPVIENGKVSNGAVPVWTPDTYIKNQIDTDQIYTDGLMWPSARLSFC